MATSTVSAREIADYYGLPFEITAKTLQRLKDTGLIQSAQGSRGGYVLNRSLDDVSLAEFLNLMERNRSAASCCNRQNARKSECEYQRRCEIQSFMTRLDARVFDFLSKIRLTELTEGALTDGDRVL